MNKINDVVEYLKQTNVKYPNLKDNNSKISILETIYKDLDLICKNINYPKSPSKKIKNILNEIEPIDSMYHGSYTYLKRENLLLENVTKLEIKNLYPQNFVHIYHNTSKYDDLKYYSYLVENRNQIKNKLYYDENVLFEFLKKFSDFIF